MGAFRDSTHGGCNFPIMQLLETSRCICSGVVGDDITVGAMPFLQEIPDTMEVCPVNSLTRVVSSWLVALGGRLREAKSSPESEKEFIRV